MLQNSATKKFATVKKGLTRNGDRIAMQDRVGEVDLPWELFKFERIDSRGRSFEDLPSDKVSPARYRIMNVASRQYLSFIPAPIKLYQSARCVPDGTAAAETIWNVKASGAGYYALHNTAGFSLGQKWPERSTSGTFHPLYSAGRV